MSRLPRRWATDTNYSSGVDSGTPVRVDPGAGLAPQGVIPHEGFAAQHWNHQVGGILDVLHEYITTRERKLQLRDDFFTAVSDTNLLYSDLLWRSEENGSPAISHAAGTSDGRRPGQLIVSVPTSSDFAFYHGAPTTALTLFEFFEHMTVNVLVNDDPDNTTTNFSIGLMQDPTLANGGTNGLTLVYNKAFATWQLSIRKDSDVTHLYSTIIPVVQNEWVTVDWDLIPTDGHIQIKINGDVVFNVAAEEIPEGECNFGANISAGASDPEIFSVKIDLMALTCDMGTDLRHD